MAQVSLMYDEADKGLLPHLCMKCGAKASAHVEQKFAWYPPWMIIFLFLGVWPLLLVAALATWKMRVLAPMCASHRHHWAQRSWVGWGGILVLVAGGFATTKLPHAMAGTAVVAMVCGLLAWLVTLAVMGTIGIRPLEITGRDITLGNVAQTFADALREERLRHPERVIDARPAPRRSSALPLLLVLGFLIVVAIACGAPGR